MPSDAAHAKFLYTILKQLDLKSIDWPAVAAQLEITNGHAARMRFSRFKQHMEGVVPSPRRRARAGSTTAGGGVGSTTSRPRKTIVKSEKNNGASKKCPSADKIKTDGDGDGNGSPSPDQSGPMALRVKPEPMEDIADFPGLVGSGYEADGEGKGAPMAEQQMRGIAANSSETPAAPSTTPEVATAPLVEGPTRRDFGPFGGVYPPPGMPTPTAMPVPQKEEEEEEEEPHTDDPNGTMIKAEPKGA
ncbi:MAG: hypothetical protein M1837_007424 [Sclerophora amabilis]|nr:MAG: hypothetical protein M1837_007424 [Sclerophora amabilis]